MKANEAPEKIYCEFDSHGCILEAHHTKWPCDIEYTRTDAFVEKVCKWLKNDTYGYLIEIWGETTIDREELVEDFKKYMEDKL